MIRRNIFLGAVIIAAIIPTGFQVYTYTKANTAMEQKSTFRLKVAGFDPRDFSRGRFATVEIDWDTQIGDKQCIETKGTKYNQRLAHACSLCLTKVSASETKNTLVLPQNTQHCDQIIAPVALWSNDIDLKRFYVTEGNSRNIRFYLDERLADKVDTALREREHDFTIDAVFSTPTSIIARELYINGVPHKEFIEQNAKEQNK